MNEQSNSLDSYQELIKKFGQLVISSAPTGFEYIKVTISFAGELEPKEGEEPLAISSQYKYKMPEVEQEQSLYIPGHEKHKILMEMKKIIDSAGKGSLKGLVLDINADGTFHIENKF